MNYTLSKHARKELINRQIPKDLLEKVLNEPQQIIEDEFDTFIYQSIIQFPNGKDYLIRIIVAEREPLHVITVYRTSKIKKYWR
ncbi:MAG: DUF4258 domain-containing protein [Bacteroidetes bacterium]|nr:DUF4258 domain-containing protein [Bacteroidota bacterium]